MDDASSDGTAALAASYGDRITYYRQPQNRGQFQNVNDGISMAEGKYIAVYHSDDYYLPTIVDREVEFLESHPETGAVFAIDVFIDGDGRQRGKLTLPPEVRGTRELRYPAVLDAILKYKNAIFRAPSSMVRASVYRSVGPYRGKEFPVAADFEMFLRIARRHS